MIGKPGVGCAVSGDPRDDIHVVLADVALLNLRDGVDVHRPRVHADHPHAPEGEHDGGEKDDVVHGESRYERSKPAARERCGAPSPEGRDTLAGGEEGQARAEAVGNEAAAGSRRLVEIAGSGKVDAEGKSRPQDEGAHQERGGIPPACGARGAGRRRARGGHGGMRGGADRNHREGASAAVSGA